ANDRDDMVILAFEVPRDGHTLRRRQRGAGMSCAELVVLGLGPHEESRDAAELTERVELIPPASEHLVDVRLMTGVPHDLVARRYGRISRRARTSRSPSAIRQRASRCAPTSARLPARRRTRS